MGKVDVANGVARSATYNTHQNVTLLGKQPSIILCYFGAMRPLIAACTALFVMHLVDFAYFGGAYTQAAEAIIRNVAFAITNVVRGW